MQMIPPSDSLGRTADVSPSKWHSPTAASTQLLTLCYFNRGLWLTQLDRQWLQWLSWLQARPLLTCTFARMREWCPSILVSLKNTPQVSTHPSYPPREKIRKSYFYLSGWPREKYPNIKGHSLESGEPATFWPLLIFSIRHLCVLHNSQNRIWWAWPGVWKTLVLLSFPYFVE